jgi:hypothetical protein
MGHEEFVELIADAALCARLSKWEANFIASMEERLGQSSNPEIHLTEKQLEVLQRIRDKVYAT